MICKSKPEKKWWRLVILFIVLTAWPLGAGAADDDPRIQSINPVPDFTQNKILLLSPEEKAGIREGVIERVESDFMVISDATRRLAPSVRYSSEFDGPGESPLQFKVGTLVGFRINEKREIYEMWLIK